MENLSLNPFHLTGQKYVEWLLQDALNIIKNTHNTGYLNIDLGNQANVEANTTRDYHGRYLFELIQNANDAIVAAKSNPHWSKQGPYRVRLEITNSALIVANDGVPFLEKDVYSVHRWGESSKDPNKSVGHKGIGFKSVLEITNSPEVFSQVVQFRFDRDTCHRLVRTIVGNGVELNLPINRFVLPYSVEKLKADKELVNYLLNDEQFATVIRLPLRINWDNVLDRIREDIQSSLLLFLNGVDEIEVRILGEVDTVLRKDTKSDESEFLGQEITLLQNQTPISRWLLFDAPKQSIDNRVIIKELEDRAWGRIEKIGYAVAFPLDEQGQLQIDVDESKLFVYFPTKLDTGLRYLIHGDFYIDSARKQINSRPYNLWLAKQIASFLDSTVVPELIERFPQNERVVQALAPRTNVFEFVASLHEAIFERLRKTPFVPTFEGKSESPLRIMFAPPGASIDITWFRQFFPPTELSSMFKGRQFPLPGIENDERLVDFLVRLGAKRLEFVDVFKLFDGRVIVKNTFDYPALYSFLWDWHENLFADRRKFTSALEDSHCIVTDRDSWIKPHERLYHAKLRQESSLMPRAVRADLVHPEAYDTEGRAGATYRLLEKLSPRVRDYDAPDIIRNAIIPLFDGNKFQNLPSEERNEIYRYLFDYWRTRRGAGDADVERIKSKVQVPARLISNRRRDEWRSVTQVYLSSVWTGDNRLEKLYKDSKKVAFLYEIRDLDVGEEDCREWTEFWKWLGVTIIPRLLVNETPGLSWDYLRYRHPHAGTHLWLEYLREIETQHAHCPKHKSKSRYLRRSVALEGFAEVIEAGNGEQLQLFYDLLAEHWVSLKRNGMAKAEVYCSRSQCAQYARTGEVLSFFEYLLRHTEWIPTQTEIDGKRVIKLRKPNHCWFVASSEEPIIRSLIPTPLTSPNQPEHRQFCHDIGMRFIEEATLDDLVDLLRHLPEHYPDPGVPVIVNRRKNPRALVSFSRWIIGRINNLLASLNYRSAPLAEKIPLVALEADIPRYIYPPDPVFFADDRYHAPRWRDHLPFVSMDDNWRDAARYLGLEFISKCVTDSCTPGKVLEAESNRLEKHIRTAIPFILAVVNDQRTSVTEDVARYLSNLKFVVVDGLTVHRSLTIPPEKVIPDPAAKFFLEQKSSKRLGSAGRALRSGTLYVRKGFEANYDILAGPIAEYINIPGLADAFVVLLDRGGKDGRLRFLETRSLQETHVEEMRRLFKQFGVALEDADEISKIEVPDLTYHLLRQLPGNSRKETAKSSPPPSLPPSLPKSSPPRREKTVDFPEFNLNQIGVTMVDVSEKASVKVSNAGGRGGGGGSGAHDWEHNQKLREIYGERGERLVKLLELKRLSELGVENPEECVHWLREEGNTSADHDLESKDYIDGKWIDIIIEVKATPTEEFRFPMSKEELECALHYQNQYRLYRVINIALATPQVYIFENPYTLWHEGKAVIEPKDTYVTLSDPRKIETNLDTTRDE